MPVVGTDGPGHTEVALYRRRPCCRDLGLLGPSCIEQGGSALPHGILPAWSPVEGRPPPHLCKSMQDRPRMTPPVAAEGQMGGEGLGALLMVHMIVGGSCCALHCVMQWPQWVLEWSRDHSRYSAGWRRCRSQQCAALHAVDLHACKWSHFESVPLLCIRSR